MKKLALFLMFLIGMPYVLSYDNVTLEYDYPSQVFVGEEIEIKVKLTNTAGNNVWECKVRIDKEKILDYVLPFVDFKVDEAKFKAPLYYKKHDKYGEDQVSLKIVFKKGIRGGTYTIPIVFSGRVGACKDGCIPLPPQEKKIKIVVIVPKPFLSIQTNKRVEVKTDTVDIPFVLKNSGTGKAKNIVITTSPGELPTEVDLNSTELAPEGELEGKIILDASQLSTGIYTLDINLTYSDENYNNSGKKETVEIVVTKETTPTTTPPPENDKGDTYYAQGMQNLSDKSYEEAINSFIDAEFHYLNAGNTEKALECRTKIEAIINLLNAEKEVENTDKYLLIIGLLIGSALSGIGLTVWLYNKEL
ncbi:MAG: hypothetical protein J7L10_01915 [Methanomicrobia archaeon]|nr:hypothetical protein [Methanomicrobia archaeon]